jgi:hypothetical protein
VALVLVMPLPVELLGSIGLSRLTPLKHWIQPA